MDKELADMLRQIRNNDISSKLKDIAKYIKEKDELADSYMKQLQSFRKDDEIKKLEDEIEKIRKNSIGEFIGNEKERYEKFAEKHYKLCNANTEIRVSGSGLGLILKCCCLKCGEIEDITDSSAW